MARVVLASLLAASCVALQAPCRTAAPRARAVRPLFSEPDDEYVRSTGVIAAGGFNTAGAAPRPAKHTATRPDARNDRFSLAKAFLGVGTVVTVSSFVEFFSSSGSAGLSSIGFIYGIPILLIGCSLQYAELEPVPMQYDGDEEKLEVLFEAQANECMKTIRDDVTRHRYGDEAHLDTTVRSLGLVPPGKPYPQLITYQLAGEDVLKISLVFESPETPFNDWSEEKRIKKYNAMFGPGVTASVIKVDAEKRLVAIQLVFDTPGGAPAEVPAAV